MRLFEKYLGRNLRVVIKKSNWELNLLTISDQDSRDQSTGTFDFWDYGTVYMLE